MGWGARRASVGLAVLLMAGGVLAGEVKVRAEVNSTRIGLEDQVQLSVVIEGGGADVEDIVLPSFDGLRLVGGPSVSTQVSIVNGSISQSRRFVYALQPLQVGHTEIGPIRVRLRNGEQTTAPIDLEVVTGSVVPRARPADPFADFFGPDPFEQMMGRRRAQPTGKIVVEATPSRTELYVGEPLLLTYYLYTQTRLSGIDFEEAPKFQGFWAEDLPRDDDAGKPTSVAHDGEQFQRFAVFRKLLFPTKAGTLTIPAARFRIGMPRQIGFFSDPIPGAAQLVSRTSNTVDVTVKPLPDEPGFAGAVGSFRVGSTLDRAELGIGDAATLRLRVEGRGNLKWVERAPELVVPGAKVYPPQVKSNLTAGETGISGSKTWEYVIVPETAGRLAIPAQTFAYFDPAAAQVTRAQTLPLALLVRPAVAAAAAPGGGAGPAPAGAQGLRLRGELDLPAVALPRLGVGVLVGIVVAVLAGHALLLGVALPAARRRRDRSPAPPHRSLRRALAELRAAGRGGTSKENAALAIERTLVDIFGPLDERADGGGEREVAVREVLHEVRFIRYAPQLGDYSEKIREVAGRAADVVKRWG